MTSQMLLAVLCAMGVDSRYNLAAKFSCWDNSLWIGKVRTLNMEINEWARNTKTKKYLVEEFDEDVHGEFVPYRVLLLGLLTYLIVHNGDKVLEVNQFHLTKLCKCGKV